AARSHTPAQAPAPKNGAHDTRHAHDAHDACAPATDDADPVETPVARPVAEPTGLAIPIAVPAPVAVPPAISNDGTARAATTSSDVADLARAIAAAAIDAGIAPTARALTTRVAAPVVPEPIPTAPTVQVATASPGDAVVKPRTVDVTRTVKETLV